MSLFLTGVTSLIRMEMIIQKKKKKNTMTTSMKTTIPNTT